MKRSLLVAAILSATFITACSKHHNNDASAPGAAAVDTKKELEKTAWTTGCQTESYNYGVSYSTKLEFKDGFLTTSRNFYKTADCSGTPLSSSTKEVNAYEVDNASSSVQLMNISGGQPGQIGAEKVKGDKLMVKVGGNKLKLVRIDGSGNMSSADYIPYVEPTATDTSLIPHDKAPGPVAPYMYGEG